MKASTLRNLFGLSILFFIAHGLEEYFTGIYAVDSHIQFIFGFLEETVPLQVSFLLFQLFFWTTLTALYFSIFNTRWMFWATALVGLIFFYELYHFAVAFSTGGYYPGLVTTFLFPILGFFYWREWMRCNAILLQRKHL